MSFWFGGDSPYDKKKIPNLHDTRDRHKSSSHPSGNGHFPTFYMNPKRIWKAKKEHTYLIFFCASLCLFGCEGVLRVLVTSSAFGFGRTAVRTLLQVGWETDREGDDHMMGGEESNIWICDMNIEGKAGGNICTGEYIRYNISYRSWGPTKPKTSRNMYLKYSFDGRTFPSKHIATQ